MGEGFSHPKCEEKSFKQSRSKVLNYKEVKRSELLNCKEVKRSELLNYKEVKLSLNYKQRINITCFGAFYKIQY